LHGTGKTSFLGKLIEIAGDHQVLGVMPTLDPNRTAHDHLSSILRAVAKGIDGVSKASGRVISDFDARLESKLFRHVKTERLESDFVRQDFETLESMAKAASITGTVVCIDEGQRIEPLALSALKNALQHMSSYLVVISLRLIADPEGAVSAGKSMLDDKARAAEGDIGASRFYVHGIAMGPFDTEKEAAECIERRLEGNAVKFTAEVIGRIGRITGRIPRDMIELSGKLYDRTVESKASTADLTLLHEAFTTLHRSKVTEARALCDGVSHNARIAMKALLELASKTTCERIVSHLYPGLNNHAKAYVVEGVQSDLARAVESSTLVRSDGDLFFVSDPISAYALELSLGGI